MREYEPGRFQQVLNQRRPRGHREIGDQHHTDWVGVLCLVRWERDGIELVEALAKRWTDGFVYATFADARLYGGGVWLPARDVQRRP